MEEIEGVLHTLADLHASHENNGTAGAANIWAGTENLETVDALNRLAGNPPGQYREFEGVCNQLAGTTGMGGVGALNLLAQSGPPEPEPPPVANSILPNSGPAAGGTPTVIVMAAPGAADVTDVIFGSTSGTAVSAANPLQVRSTSPPGNGPTMVVVRTPRGDSNPVQFFYPDPPVSGAQSYQDAVLASGPGVLWPLGQADYAGGALEIVHGLIGTVVGVVVPQQRDPWGTNFATGFDGATGFIYDPTTGYVATQPFSVEFWYWSTASGGIMNLGTPASLPMSAGTFPVAMYLAATTEVEQHAAIGDLMGFVRAATTNGVPADVAPSNNGMWHHAVMTRTGSNVLLYRDGQQVGAATLGGGVQAGTYYSQFGVSGNAARGGWFNGRLCFVAIYGRVLTPAEITQHFAAGGAVVP